MTGHVTLQLLTLNMPEASQSSFPLSVRNAIHVRYGNRCVLCLSRDGDHCAHVVDRSSTRGRELVRMKSNTHGSGLNIYFSASPGSTVGSLAYGF